MTTYVPRYPELVVNVELDGPGGNVFAVIGECQAALARAGVDREQLAAFRQEVMSSDTYDGALEACRRWVDLITH